MAERLECPDCGEHRIARVMETTVDYIVSMGEYGDVDIEEPADIQHGHVQYEIMGPWGDNAYCMNKECNLQGGLEDFILDDEEDIAP